MDVDRLHPVTQLYLLSTVDCLIELAAAVARDEEQRPDRYEALGTDTRALCRSSRPGSDSALLDLDERTSLYEVVSGRPGKTLSPLAAAEWSFRDAALAVTNATGERRSVFAKTFAESAASLRSFLELVGGEQAYESAKRLVPVFDQAIAILTNDAVASVFHVQEVPKPPWPFGDDSPAGANLVEAISDDLQPETTGYISQYEFLVVERLARHRGRVVQALMEGRFVDGAAASPENLTEVAAWHSALSDFRVSIVARAWRGEYGPLKLDPSDRIPRSPVDRAVLSPEILDFISACAGDGT